MGLKIENFTDDVKATDPLVSPPESPGLRVPSTYGQFLAAL
jgi:hypothetical protein